MEPLNPRLPSLTPLLGAPLGEGRGVSVALPLGREPEIKDVSHSAAALTSELVSTRISLELLREVSQHADIRAASHACLSEVARLTRPDLVGSLFLLEPEIGKFRLYANYKLNLSDSNDFTLFPQEMFGRAAYETLMPSVASSDDILPFVTDEVKGHHNGRVPQEVITIPLLYDGRCFALMNLEHYDRNLPLSKAEIERAMGYCQLVAPVLRHMQLYEGSRQRELDQIQLNKVLHAVNATLDIEAILKTIRRSLGHGYRFDMLAVCLIDTQRHELRYQYVHGNRITPEQLDRYRALRLHLASGDSVHIRAVATLQPIQICDIPPGVRMSSFDRQAYEIAPFRSMVVFPLVHDQEPIGTLVFVNQLGRTDLAPGQIAYLQRFVSQVVTAIENTRQLEESRAAQRELQIKNLAIQSQSELITTQHKELYKKSEALFEQSRELEALVKIMQVVNEEMELGRIMDAILEEGTLMIPGAEKGAFVSFDPGERCFRIIAQRGYDSTVLNEVRLNWRQATGRYMPTKGELLPGIYVTSRRELSPLPGAESLPNPETTLTLVVNVKGALQGFLVFDNFSSPAAFADVDTGKLQRLLEHAATAFYKARYLQEIQDQKTKLEDAYRKISDSINYARRILEAILPRAKDIRAALPEHFVLFRPRDVVSGDFYWFTQVQGRVVMAAVDCTGHGIPGAFMSVLGNTLLNHVVNEKGIVDPGTILNELDTRVKRMLGQFEADSETLDGMDVALWTLEPETGLLQFAGANRPLLYWQGGQLHEVKGQRRPVGGLMRHGQEAFTTHTVQMTPGDVAYLFTDGITDQFGGKPPKKFLTSRFRELVSSVAELSMKEQSERIASAHVAWRGRSPQMDDILVIGMRYGAP